jgi:hypothetical protein
MTRCPKCHGIIRPQIPCGILRCKRFVSSGNHYSIGGFSRWVCSYHDGLISRVLRDAFRWRKARFDDDIEEKQRKKVRK